MSKYLFMLIVFSLYVLSSSASALEITTNNLNMTFDEAHGGVLSSMKFKGKEFLVNNGAWGTIGLMKTKPSRSNTCDSWAKNMSYQYYQDDADIKHSEDYVAHYVDISTDVGELRWKISKLVPTIEVEITPKSNREYVYIPLLKNGTLTFYTADGEVKANNTAAYCVSPRFSASLAEYEINSKKVMVFNSKLFPWASYYGSDSNSWLLHYSLNDIKSLFFIFY